MAYIAPSEFVTKMVDAGESKIYMSTRDTLIRAYMAGAILSLAAVFAITATVMSGSALVGAVLFPVGFCMLYLLGFDLLTGVFVLAPLALLDKRPGVTLNGVLRNLLEHAMQATEAGGSISLVAERVPGAVNVRVRDTGRGIDPEIRQRLFEPFFTTRQEGTGLGLAIVRGVVESHGGEVAVESAPGAGSTFTLRLPLVADAVAA